MSSLDHSSILGSVRVQALAKRLMVGRGADGEGGGPGLWSAKKVSGIVQASIEGGGWMKMGVGMVRIGGKALTLKRR